MATVDRRAWRLMPDAAALMPAVNAQSSALSVPSCAGYGRRMATPAAQTQHVADVNPRLLRCFVAVAEERHFGRAAERLFVAQPALSRSIQRLERTLQRKLFVRTTRRVELSPSGLRLLGPAREVLASLDDLAAKLAGTSGVLRVAHVPCADTAAFVLDHLQRAEPSLRIEEQVLTGPEQRAAVRDGRIDVAVCPGTPAPETGLRFETLRLDPLLVAVIDRDPALTRPVNPRLRTLAVADYGADAPEWSAFVRAYEERTGCALQRIRCEPGSGTEAHAMRRAGALAFVTTASRGIRLDQPCPTFGAVPVQGYLPWSMAWRTGTRPAALQRFIDAARFVAAQRGWNDTTALPGEPWVMGGPVGTGGDAWTYAA
jgi:DNA-binding transcriptional LysR family regulator